MKLKKFATVVATFAMVMAMTATAFAANYSGDAVVTTDTTLNIPKSLIVSNPDLASVAGPGLSYSYVIESVTPSASNGGTTITDKETPAHTATVHAGPTNGVTLTTATLNWPVTESETASPSGAANTKNIVASVDLTKFSAPGIYRYGITESASVTPSSVGVSDADAAEVRYLDVYIERDSNDALIVKGYVVHDGTTEDGAPASKRTFDSSSFETRNVTLKKNVSGSMGDRQNQFPFAGTVVDNGRFFYAKKGAAPTATSTDLIAGGASSAISTTLAHSEVYYISGLSTLATVSYTETNNTPDTYATSIKIGSTGSYGTAEQIAPNGTKASAATVVTTADEVTFDNNFESVSPTGLVLRYGPYVGMLLIAAALVFFNRRKAAEDEE